MSQVEVDSMDL